MQNSITTERLVLEHAGRDAGAAVLTFHELNRGHLSPWEPRREPSYYTLSDVDRRLTEMRQQTADASAVHWLIRLHESPEVIGQCSFTNIVRGPFQACHLGFSLACWHQGQGVMHEALKAAIAHLFDAQKLHRIMANYQPDNHRSARLLARLGFEKEGLAKRCLKINGRWTDHVLTSLINPQAADD